MNNLIVKALLDDPPPGNEDLYAANLEVVEKAIEAGLLTKKANGGFTLADGQDMVLYDLRNGEAQVYKA